MSGSASEEHRHGPFWDVVAGRRPAPPVASLLGWHLEQVDPDEGTIVVRFEARPEFTNPAGVIQGGILASMLDDTMGPALVATLPPGQFSPTLELKVSFFEPARVGPLWGHGRVVKRGGSTAFVEGDLRDAEGRLLARASATVRIVTLEPPPAADGSATPDGAAAPPEA